MTEEQHELIIDLQTGDVYCKQCGCLVAATHGSSEQ